MRRVAWAIAWGFTHRVCAGEQNGCVPVPPGALGPCIRTDGDVACPDGFAHHVVTGTAVTDPACGSCPECVSEANARCANANITTYGDSGCSDAQESLPAETCSQGANSVAITGTSPPACPPAQFVGDLADPVTFCCVMGA